MTTVKRVIPEARQIAKTCIVLLSKIDLLLYFHNINWAPIVKRTAFMIRMRSLGQHYFTNGTVH